MLYMDVLAQVTPPAPSADEPWYKALVGIITIPVTIVGFITMFPALRKMRLESRKIELEIAEKEAALKVPQGSPTSSTEASREERLTQLVAQPLLEGRRVQELILRFIVLYLSLQAWSVVGQFFAFGGGWGIGAIEGAADETTARIGYVIYHVVSQIPTVGYYVLILGLGGPIFVQCLRHLNIPVPKLVARLESPKPIAYALVVAVFLLIGLFTGLSMPGPFRL